MTTILTIAVVVLSGVVVGLVIGLRRLSRVYDDALSEPPGDVVAQEEPGGIYA